MANVSATCCKCGTTTKINADTTAKARERAEYLAANGGVTCYDCYRAEKSAKDAADAAAAIGDIDLADLDGSDKQADWATKIRAEKMAAFLTTADAKRTKIDGIDPRFETLVSQITTAMAGQTSSKFWIENRGKSVDDLVKMLAV